MPPQIESNTLCKTKPSSLWVWRLSLQSSVSVISKEGCSRCVLVKFKTQHYTHVHFTGYTLCDCMWQINLNYVFLRKLMSNRKRLSCAPDRTERESVLFLCRAFDQPRRSAGSDEEMNLANRIFDEFRKLEMDPWTDIHYVQLQTADRLIQHFYW